MNRVSRVRRRAPVEGEVVLRCSIIVLGRIVFVEVVIVIVDDFAELQIPNVRNAAPKIVFAQGLPGVSIRTIGFPRSFRFVVVVGETRGRVGTSPPMRKGRYTGRKTLGDRSGVQLNTMSAMATEDASGCYHEPRHEPSRHPRKYSCCSG